MDAITPKLGLIKPEVGGSDDTWGEKTNRNWDTVDKMQVAIVSPSPPPIDADGQLWYNLGDGELYVSHATNWVITNTFTVPPGSIHTGDIADKAVTNVKLADVPAWTLKGNATGVAAVPQDFNIAALAAKAAPVPADNLLIADSAAANAFKKVPWSSLPSGGGGGTTVYVADVPPTGVSDNSLWWNSSDGCLYICYNDGTSTQWVIAEPIIDTTKVNALIASMAVRYDAAQSLAVAQQTQARSNIGLGTPGPFYSGTDAANLTGIIAGSVMPEQFGAYRDGTHDDRVAVQACFDYAKVYCCRVVLTGTYAVSQAPGQSHCVLLDSSVVVVGSGSNGNYFPGGWIKPLATVPPTCDIVKIRATAVSVMNFLTLEHFTIGAPGVGRYQIFIDNNVTVSSDRRSFGLASFRGLCLLGNTSQWSIFHRNDGQVDPLGGMYESVIEHCIIDGGIRLENCGTLNRIHDNYIYGNVSGVAVYASPLSYSVGFEVTSSNIADYGGAIVIDSGNDPRIVGNSIEMSGSNGGSMQVGTGAIIDIATGSATVDGAIIEGNYINNASGDAYLVNHVRLGAHAKNTYIGVNRWASTNAAQLGYTNGCWVLNESTNLTMDVDQSYEAAMPHEIVEAGSTGTARGVKTTATAPIAGSLAYWAGTGVLDVRAPAWTAYSPTVTGNTGTVAVGSMDCSYKLLDSKTALIDVSVTLSAASTSPAPNFLQVTFPPGITVTSTQALAFSDSNLSGGAAFANGSGVLLAPSYGSIPNTARTYYASGTLKIA